MDRTLPEQLVVGIIVPTPPSDTVRRALSEAAGSGWTFRPVDGFHEAERLFRGREICAVVVDTEHPDVRTLDRLQQSLHQLVDVPVVVIADDDGPNVGPEVIRSGAEEYVGREEATGPALVHALQCSIERQRVEQQIGGSGGAHSRAESWFRTIFEHVADAILLHDDDGWFLDVNPAAERSLGYSREELLEMNLQDVVTSHARRWVPDYRQRLDRGETVTVGGIHHRKDGDSFPVEVRLARVDVEGKSAILAIARDVSERVRALEALKESEERFRSTFEQAAVGICHVLPGGRFVRVNKRFCELLGYSQEELLGLTVQDITHSDDIDTAGEVASEILSGNVPHYQIDKRYVHKDGHSVWARLTVSLVRSPEGEPDYAIAVTEDITAERVEAAARRVAEERLRSVISTAGSVIIVLSPTGLILEFSDSAEEIFGVQKADVLEKSYYELFLGPEEVEAFRADMARVLEGESTRNFVKPIISRNRTRRVLSWNFDRVVDQSGEVMGLVAIGHDITEQQRLEEQFRQAQKMEAVGSLAGGIAHDFNNLLTAISGFTQMAMDALPDGHAAHADMEEVQRSAARAADLTKQLLAFSRKQRISPEVVDLRERVRDTRKMLQRVLGEDIELRGKLGGEPALVMADATQLEQVLLNLAVNARDAMPEGGTLTIAVSTRTVGVPLTLSHAEVPPGRYSTLMVADDGEGMAPQTISRIFEPFFTTKETGSGTGLGLSTVWGIVSQAGGYIDVSSEPGRGTAFLILLPYRTDPPTKRPVERSVSSPGPATGTILLVEDEHSVRRLAVKVLTRGGYEVHEAADAAEALELAAVHGDDLDILVTDVVMPGMSGARLAQRLRPMYPELPILFISGYTEERLPDLDDVESGSRLLSKPFSPAALLEAVHQLLAPHEPR